MSGLISSQKQIIKGRRDKIYICVIGFSDGLITLCSMISSEDRAQRSLTQKHQ